MKPFNCLDPSQEITGYFFLEASAGTGKTFAIEHIVARLIVEKGVRLDQILVVTFTKAAARDLKKRIRANFEKSGNKTLLDAVCIFDEAQIFTIHGFCLEMLSLFSLESGQMVLNQKEGDTAYLNILIREIKDFLRTDAHEILDTSQLDIFSDTLFDKVINALDKSHEIVKWKASIELLSEKLKGLAPSKEVLEADFATLCARYKKGKDVSSWEEQLACLYGALSGDYEQCAALIRHKKLFLSHFEPKNERKKIPPTPLLTGDLFFTLKEMVLPVHEKMHNKKQILNTVAAACQERVDRALEKEHVCPPDHLLKRMKEAIGKPLFLEKIKEKYQVVIVDEFQDTDPVQWSIFKTLFSSQLLACYLVGDPKQSIYGFRKADIKSYLDAKGWFGAENLYSLDTNYRSSKTLIEELNALFGQSNWLGEIEYHPVKAPSTAQIGELGVRVLVIEGEKRSQVEEEILFPYIANEIGKYRYRDVAILVRDRYQAALVNRVLTKAGIPSTTKGSEPLVDTPVYKGILLLFEFLEKPDQRSLLKQVLKSPLCRYSPVDLTEDLSVEWGLFKELCGKEKGELLYAFSHLPLPKGTPLERMVSSGELRDYADYALLVERICEKGLEGIEREKVMRRDVAEEDSVSIMTLHTSKGLEFPVVFVPGVIVDSPEPSHEEMRLFYVGLTRAQSHLYLPIVIAGENSSSERFARSLLGSERVDRIELLRKLDQLKMSYVDLTGEAITLEEKTPTPPPELDIEFFSPFYTPVSVQSFSSLRTHAAISEKKTPSEKEVPIGSETGTAVHLLIEKLIATGLYQKRKEREAFVVKQLLNTNLEEHAGEIAEWISTAFDTKLSEEFSLSELAPDALLTEEEFLFESGKNEWIKGTIDLIAIHNGRYYVIDWKTNFLGSEMSDYSSQALSTAIQKEAYDLQASLYAQALKKHLRHIKKSAYEEAFGGCFYIFLRGLKWSAGIHFFSP